MHGVNSFIDRYLLALEHCPLVDETRVAGFAYPDTMVAVFFQFAKLLRLGEIVEEGEVGVAAFGGRARVQEQEETDGELSPAQWTRDIRRK